MVTSVIFYDLTIDTHTHSFPEVKIFVRVLILKLHFEHLELSKMI